MGKSFSVLSVIALVVIAANIVVHRDISLPIAVSYASAQELPDFSATTTLSTAPQESWQAPEPAREQQPEQKKVEPVVEQKAQPTQTVAAKKKYVAEVPVRLIVPSIGLDTSIVGVGVNAAGEMAVPSGNTDNVGWYKYGPKPGQVGSSVLDAHVFAAFEDLRHLKVGSDIIVVTESGQRLRFVVQQSTVYKLSDITSSMLFGRKNDRWLNLITCAGKPVGNTYSHRLIVYSTFEEVL